MRIALIDEDPDYYTKFKRGLELQRLPLLVNFYTSSKKFGEVDISIFDAVLINPQANGLVIIDAVYNKCDAYFALIADGVSNFPNTVVEDKRIDKIISKENFNEVVEWLEWVHHRKEMNEKFKRAL